MNTIPKPVDVSGIKDPKKKKKNKKKKKKDLKPPEIKCNQIGHEDNLIKYVCIHPDQKQRLMCEECFLIQNEEIKENTREYKKFFNEYADLELVKAEMSIENNRWLNEKETFNKTLKLSYDTQYETLSSLFENLKKTIVRQIDETKKKVLD